MYMMHAPGSVTDHSLDYGAGKKIIEAICRKIGAGGRHGSDSHNAPHSPWEEGQRE